MKYPKPYSMGDNGDNRKYKKMAKEQACKRYAGRQRMHLEKIQGKRH